MDVQVHTFLIYTIALSILSAVIEMRNPHDVRPALARSAFVILQGVWFWTVGQILYPHFGGTPWAQDDHKKMMIVTMIFSWEIGAVVIFMFFLGELA
jgi:hypothetical protein